MLKRLTVYSTLIGASLSGLATAHGAEYGSPQEARGDQVCGVSVFHQGDRRHAN